jgi:peptidoglycan/xylan/chitin deacetylase (PgdA/CDA1 family)
VIDPVLPLGLALGPFGQVAFAAVGRAMLASPLPRMLVAAADGRGAPGGKAHILIYHRVLAEADPFAMAPVLAAEFDAQMRVLRRAFRPVSLRQLLGEAASGSLPAGSVAVTFDDGYRDNLTQAQPILEAHGIPATVFLATDFIGGKALLWYDRVLEAFRRYRQPAFAFAPAGFRASFPDTAARAKAAFRLLDWLKGFPPAQRDAHIRDLERQCGRAAETAGAETGGLMLDWDQARELRRRGVELGAHTRSHPILSTLDADTMAAEIAGSKAVLERELGHTVDLFAYPNGRREDYTSDCKEILAREGFAYALTTNPGLVRAGMDRFEIPRVQPWDRTAGGFFLRLLGDRFRA